MVTTVLTVLLLGVGLFFLTVAAIGFVRLPDVFCRLHITGVIDTLGAPVILLAAAVYVGFTLEFGKLLLAIVFLYVTAPLVGHLLAQAAVEAGYRAVLEQELDESERAWPYAAPGAQAGRARGEDDDRLQAVAGAEMRRGGEA